MQTILDENRKLFYSKFQTKLKVNFSRNLSFLIVFQRYSNTFLVVIEVL